MNVDDKRVMMARRATRFIFFVCGLGISSWAPMVPYAKDRLGLHEGHLGLLLLFIGLGALVMMPVTGLLISRYGTRKVIACSAILIALLLPSLIVIKSVIIMAAALFIFGAAIGSIDVAMNAHGIYVQNLYGRPVMSSLHGLFSVGGLAGSLGLGFLVKAGLDPLHAAFSIAGLLLVICLSQYRHLFPYHLEQDINTKYSTVTDTALTSNNFLWLRRSVVFLGTMCFIVFLSEGAMLDWSAVFLRDTKAVPQTLSGAGYAAFSVAMATMRLLGDGLVEKFDRTTIVSGGSLLAAFGLLVAIFSPWFYMVLVGYILLGIGAANIVPVFFSDGGRLKGIPASVSIPAITTMGYAGQLAGPALLGFIAHHISLPAAFGCCAILLIITSLSYWIKEQKYPLTISKIQ